jgi:hypothetical protein
MARDGFSHGRFLVEHVIRPMINLYKITPLAVGDTPAGGPIAYADEQETQELFNARSIFDIGSARYDVIDGQGGSDRRHGGFLRKVAVPFDLQAHQPEGREVTVAQESSLPLAVARWIVERYVLDIAGDQERVLDRRQAIALAIGLDALQNH